MNSLISGQRRRKLVAEIVLLLSVTMDGRLLNYSVQRIARFYGSCGIRERYVYIYKRLCLVKRNSINGAANGVKRHERRCFENLFTRCHWLRCSIA